MAMFEDFADRYFPSTQSYGRVDAQTAAIHAAMLTGNWVNSRGSQSNFLAVLSFVSQTKVSLDSKGGLVLPFMGLNGKPRHWIEASPFLWFDPDDHQRLAAKVVDGRVVRFSMDELSPFMVFERAPWYQDGAWLIPALCASVAVLVITALSWPVTAIVRRRYRAPLTLDSRSLRAYRLSKIAAIAIPAALGLWGVTLVLMIKDNDNLSSKFDLVVRCAQLFGVIAFFGGLALTLWNMWVVGSGVRRWPARVWSLTLVISAAVVLWTAFAFKLLSFGLNY
jgi:hypothetical protein